MIRLTAAACVVVALLLGARSATACQCPSQFVTTVLPEAGSTDVPTDATIVVFSSIGAETKVRLADAAGADVPLTHVRTLEASPGCGTGLQDVLFFRPVMPLAVGSAHTIEVRFFPVATGQTDTPTRVTFTTGAGPRVAGVTPVLRPELHAIRLPDGSRALQFYARADGPAPSFVSAKGNPATIVLGLGPLAFQTPTHVALGFIDCAEVEHVDITGQTLASVRMCEPAKCGSTSTLICSTCGQNCGWQLSANIWAGAPACNAAPTPVASAAPAADGGCNVGSRPSAAAGLSPLLLLALGLWARRRR